MPEKPLLGSQKPQKPAVGLTPLPSLPRWESVWERTVDLTSLRGRSAEFARLRKLAEDPRHKGLAPHIEDGQIRALVDDLNLSKDSAAQLLEDARLIAEWYLAPQLQRRVWMGQEVKLQQLRKAAASAQRFSRQLELEMEPYAVEFEHILGSMYWHNEPADDLDLLALIRNVRRFGIEGKRAVETLDSAGRKKDERRNGAISLSAWAAEAASEERVRISRGSEGDENPHFTNATGRFVHGFMSLLGWCEVRLLVGAFEKMRRQKSVNLRTAKHR